MKYLNSVLMVFLFLSFTHSPQARAELTINLHLYGEVGTENTAVTGLLSESTANPGYGGTVVYTSQMIGTYDLRLTIYSMDPWDNRLLFTLSGYCGAFAIESVDGGLTWPSDVNLTIASAGNCNFTALDLPWPDPNKKEIFSAPYHTGEGVEPMLKYEATRSVLLQFGADLTQFCNFSCPIATETCSPEAMVLKKFSQGGNVEREKALPARDPYLRNKLLVEDRYTPSPQPGGPTEIRLQGTVYCLCMDFTKP